MRKNRYAGSCSGCGKSVAAEAGVLIGPPWKTLCNPCAGVTAKEETFRVKLTLEGHEVVIRAVDWLGSKFEAFRSATSGSRYDGVNKTNRASIDKVAPIIEALKFSGFTLDIHPEVVAAVQAKTSEMKAGVALAAERADAVDLIMKEKGLSLYSFQRTGVSWLTPRSGALLADEMGLGKTIQTLIALPNNAPVVVICPAVAKGVWKREVEKWRPDYKVTVLSGRGSFRFPEPGEMVVTNYDILSDSPEGAPKGLVVIADEAHAIKSSKTARGKRFRALSEAAQKVGGKVWLLTATPLLNRPQELWSVLSAANLAREAFGSWDRFVGLFEGYQNGWGGYEWGTPDESVVGPLLRKVSLRRLRTEVLPELPTKMWSEITVEVDASTQKLCDKVLKALSKGKKEISEEDLLSDLETLKSSSATEFEGIAKARAALAKAKIGAMLEIVEEYEEQEEPLVVFSAHRAPIDLLGERDGWATITGDTPPEKRTQIEESFQRGELKGVACTIKAGGVAITLTRAAHALFVDREWTPALNDQAEDRICRIGQSRGVVIKTLVANHVLDARIYQLLTRKRQFISGSVDAARIQSNETPEAPTVTEVDFAELERLSKLAADEAAKSEAQMRSLTDRLAAYEVEKAAAKAEKRKVRQDLMEPGRRPAANAMEEWAAEALQILAENDPDRARDVNGVGFNGADGGIGHRLANETYMGLTETQWSLAVKLCRKYWRQVGSPPKG